MRNTGLSAPFILLLIIFGFILCSACLQKTDTGPNGMASQPTGPLNPPYPPGGPGPAGPNQPGIPGVPGTLSTPGIPGSPTATGTPATAACSSGQTNCGGSCVDTQTSSQHCGKCNNPCSGGEICLNGKCGIYVVGSPIPLDAKAICTSTGNSWCSSSCVDTQSNTQHCGKCNSPCASGQSCSSGKCGMYIVGSIITPNSQTLCIASGKSWCSGTCTDLNTDSSNCGSCGYWCTHEERCYKGSCGDMYLWTGKWIDEVGVEWTLAQSGNSVTGKTTSAGAFPYEISGTTSGTPPDVTGTWTEMGNSGTLKLSMSADGTTYYAEFYDTGHKSTSKYAALRK